MDRFNSNDVIIFDLCGTLYESNTTFDFLDFYFKNNRQYAWYRKLSKTYIIRALNKATIAFFNWDIIRIIGVRFFKGLSKTEVEKKIKLFNSTYLSSRKIGLINALLLEAREQNSKIVLMSASLDVIVEEIAQELGITEFYSTQLTCVDKIYTGAIHNDLLGLKHHLVKDMNIKNKRVIFITDNISDYNVIEYVDEFIAVSTPKNLNFWKKANGVKYIYEI